MRQIQKSTRLVHVIRIFRRKITVKHFEKRNEILLYVFSLFARIAKIDRIIYSLLLAIIFILYYYYNYIIIIRVLLPAELPIVDACWLVTSAWL